MLSCLRAAKIVPYRERSRKRERGSYAINYYVVIALNDDDDDNP
jgi:hypothetical protein